MHNIGSPKDLDLYAPPLAKPPTTDNRPLTADYLLHSLIHRKKAEKTALTAECCESGVFIYFEILSLVASEVAVVVVTACGTASLIGDIIFGSKSLNCDKGISS